MPASKGMGPQSYNCRELNSTNDEIDPSPGLGGRYAGEVSGRFTAVNNGSRIRTQGRKRLESGEISSGTKKLRTNL